MGNCRTQEQTGRKMGDKWLFLVVKTRGETNELYRFAVGLKIQSHVSLTESEPQATVVRRKSNRISSGI